MDSVDSNGRVYRHPAKPKTSKDWTQSQYSYKLVVHRADILMRLAKKESMASIAKLYGCTYQAIQRIKRTYG
jgi:hypothetical protein